MRYFPRNTNVSVKVYRPQRVNGGKKFADDPTYVVEGNFITGTRKNHESQGGMYVIDYQLYVDTSTDILTGDRLVINETNYSVQKVVPVPFTNHPFKLCSVAAEA